MFVLAEGVRVVGTGRDPAFVGRGPRARSRACSRRWDPAAKSAAIICSPKCIIRRAKVESPTYDWPTCGWADALAAARTAGLRAAQPMALYGSWSSAKGVWELRETADDTGAILVDAVTCAIR